MLVLAAATFTEVKASGCDALGGGLQYTRQFGACKLPLNLSDFGFDPFSDCSERHEHYEFIKSPDALSAERNIGNGDGDSFTLGWTHADSLRKREAKRKEFLGTCINGKMQ